MNCNPCLLRKNRTCSRRQCIQKVFPVTVYDTNLHMNHHYKRVNTAKSVVNTSPPKCFHVRCKHVPQYKSRFSTPTFLSNSERIPSRTSSNFEVPQRRNVKSKDERHSGERSSSVPPRPCTRRNTNRMPQSYIKPGVNTPKLNNKNADKIPLRHKSPNPSTKSSPKFKTKVNKSELPANEFPKSPSPPPIKPIAASKDEIVPECEYLQFSLRITEDIIRNDLYSKSEMRRVFNSHIEANRGRLNMNKMLMQIDHLCQELNINKQNGKASKTRSLRTDNSREECEKLDIIGKQVPHIPCSKDELLKKILNSNYVITNEEVCELTQNELQAVISGLLNENNRECMCCKIHFHKRETSPRSTQDEYTQNEAESVKKVSISKNVDVIHRNVDNFVVSSEENFRTSASNTVSNSTIAIEEKIGSSKELITFGIETNLNVQKNEATSVEHSLMDTKDEVCEYENTFLVISEHRISQIQQDVPIIPAINTEEQVPELGSVPPSDKDKEEISKPNLVSHELSEKQNMQILYQTPIEDSASEINSFLSSNITMEDLLKKKISEPRISFSNVIHVEGEEKQDQKETASAEDRSQIQDEKKTDIDIADLQLEKVDCFKECPNRQDNISKINDETSSSEEKSIVYEDIPYLQDNTSDYNENGRKASKNIPNLQDIIVEGSEDFPTRHEKRKVSKDKTSLQDDVPERRKTSEVMINLEDVTSDYDSQDKEKVSNNTFNIQDITLDCNVDYSNKQIRITVFKDIRKDSAECSKNCSNYKDTINISEDIPNLQNKTSDHDKDSQSSQDKRKVSKDSQSSQDKRKVSKVLENLQDKTSDYDENSPSSQDKRKVSEDLENLQDKTSDYDENSPSSQDKRKVSEDLENLQDKTSDYDEDSPSYQDKRKVSENILDFQKKTSDHGKDSLSYQDKRKISEDISNLQNDEDNPIFQVKRKVSKDIPNFQNKTSDYDKDSQSTQDKRKFSEDIPNLQDKTSDYDEDDSPSFQDKRKVSKNTIDDQNDTFDDDKNVSNRQDKTNVDTNIRNSQKDSMNSRRKSSQEKRKACEDISNFQDKNNYFYSPDKNPDDFVSKFEEIINKKTNDLYEYSIPERNEEENSSCVIITCDKYKQSNQNSEDVSTISSNRSFTIKTKIKTERRNAEPEILEHLKKYESKCNCTPPSFSEFRLIDQRDYKKYIPKFQRELFYPTVCTQTSNTCLLSDGEIKNTTTPTITDSIISSSNSESDYK